MAKDKLTGRVSYRLGSQAFKQVQRLAAARDISTNEWCRQVVLEKLKSQSPSPPTPPTQGELPQLPKAEARETGEFTLAEQIIIQEIMRIRWLLQYGLRHYVTKKGLVTIEEWQYLIDQASGGGMFGESLKKWLGAYQIEVTPK